MFNPLSFISKFVKSGNQKELDRIGKIISRINILEEKFANLASEAFPGVTLKLKEKIKNGEKLDNILPRHLLWSGRHQKEHEMKDIMMFN